MPPRSDRPQRDRRTGPEPLSVTGQELGGTLPELAPGDRAPDFVLPGRDGKFYAFYERVRGHPCLLLLAGRDSGPAADVLARLAEGHAALDPAGLDVFAVLPGPPERLPDTAQGLVRTAFADVKGKVLDGFRGLLGASGDHPLCLLLDSNQRLLARIEGEDPGGLAASAAAAVAALPPPRPALSLGDSAPVLLVPAVIEPDLCRLLIDRWQTGGHAEGTVEAVSDGEVGRPVAFGRKRRLDHQLEDQALSHAVGRRVVRRLGPELEKASHFVGFQLDRFIVGCYQAERGDYFRPHRDNLAPTTRDRLFALSINLNSDDYEGGDLRFPEYGPHHYRPGTGGALVFSCSLIHEALPVTRGERFVLLSFLRDARHRMAAPSRPPSAG